MNLLMKKSRCVAKIENQRVAKRDGFFVIRFVATEHFEE